jgi:DNA-binding transcriptional ArsR family regulator
MHPSERICATDPELDAVLRALAHPVRRFLLELLVTGDAAAGDLAESAAANFGISRSRASQHLAVLVEADLLEVIVDGTWRWHRLSRSPGAIIPAWLAQLGSPLTLSVRSARA